MRLLHWSSRGATGSKIRNSQWVQLCQLSCFIIKPPHLTTCCSGKSTTCMDILASYLTNPVTYEQSLTAVMSSHVSYNPASKEHKLCSVSSNWTSCFAFPFLTLCPEATHPHHTALCVVLLQGYWPQWAQKGSHLHPVRPWLMTLK